MGGIVQLSYGELAFLLFFALILVALFGSLVNHYGKSQNGHAHVAYGIAIAVALVAVVMILRNGEVVKAIEHGFDRPVITAQAERFEHHIAEHVRHASHTSLRHAKKLAEVHTAHTKRSHAVPRARPDDHSNDSSSDSSTSTEI